MERTISRRYPIGAELISPNQTNFRVWAPKAQILDLVVETAAARNSDCSFQPLKREADGYFGGSVDIGAGTRYRFRINGDDAKCYPDPASRYQPDGPHGPSCVIDPTAFQWSDQNWCGLKLTGQIIYEFHVGTFTREGTWRAAAEKLPF